MRIESLAIRRLPGIQTGFEIKDLSPGLNLIVGPNGSGKTSLCRAFRKLVWQEGERDQGISISATMIGRDGPLQVEFDGGDLRWTKNGKETARPAFPEAHLAKCFTIEVGDLVAAEAADEDLAREVLKQMAGGYDLRNLLEADSYRVKHRYGVVEQDALQVARSALAGIRSRHLALREREAGLQQLEEDKQEARLARDDLHRREMALDLVRARHAREVAVSRLEQFDPAMSKLQGDEAEQLAELRSELADKSSESESLQATIDAAHESIEDAGLSDGAIEAIDLEKQFAGIDELRRLEAEFITQSERLHDAQTKADRALLQLGGRDLSMTLIDDAVLSRVEAFLKRVEWQARQRAEIDSRLGLLAAGKSTESTIDLREGLSALLDWQAAPRPSSTYIARMRTFAGGLTLSGCAAATLLAIAWHPAFWVLATVTLILGVVTCLQRDAEHSRYLEQLSARFERTGLSAPSVWNRKSIESRIRELSVSLAKSELEDEKGLERRRIRSHAVELQAAEKELAIERQKILRDTGLDLSLSNIGLVSLTRSLADHQDAALRRDQIRRRCDACESRAKALSVRLVEFLASHGELSESSVTSIGLHTERLRKRLEGCCGAQLRLRDAMDEKTRLQRDLDRLAEKVSWLFDSLELARGDDNTLASRLASLADYRSARDALVEAELTEKLCHGRLGEDQDLPSEDELLAQIGALSERAGSYESLITETAEIRQEIKAARDGRDLADALSREAKAIDDLDDRLEEASLAIAGRYLLTSVEAQHAKEARPEVLERATEWFAEFTNHQFELQLDGGWGDEPARFRALDTHCNQLRGLSELSTGTRSQLLIAVRMAAALHAEQGEPLPFFLDDALSTSDLERFRRVVESLARLTEHSGRQIFYLTSRPTDSGAWREIPDVNIIDLGELRALERSAVHPQDLEVSALPEVVLPRNLSAEQYAIALNVPRFDPLREISEVHLFYLLRHDLDLLYRCLRDRIEFLGPLRSFLESGRQPLGMTTSDRDRLHAWVELTQCFAQAWRIGRGLPVDRSALRRAGVSDRFLNGFAAIADENGGSAEALIKTIEERQDDRVKGFRADKCEAMREALLAAGHLDQRDTLSEDEIRAALLRALESMIEDGLMTDSTVIERVHELVHYAAQN